MKRQSLKKRSNRFAFGFLIFVIVMAIFSPWIANDQPYLFIDENGQIHYPLFENKASFQNLNFKELKQKKHVTVWLPPIPYSPTEYDLDASLEPPSFKHWLGTDEQGRDVLARLIHGSRISLMVGVFAVGLYSMIGILVGALAGYKGGRTDLWLSRLIEVVICFPVFFLVLALLSVLDHQDSSLWTIVFVIGITGWTGIARLMRGEFLKQKNELYVLSAKSLGYSSRRIMMFHILPNAISPVLVAMTFGMASAILLESSLSFLGFGVPPSEPSWGSLLSQSREFMDFAWWLMVFPGLAIFFTILSFQSLGESLKDKSQSVQKGGAF